MKDRAQLAEHIDRLAVISRIQELSLFVQDGDNNRRLKLKTALDQLPKGAYLFGAGVYTQGIYSVMYEEIVIGRMATPLEKPLDLPVDILIRDAASYAPSEVSRYHAIIQRLNAEHPDYFISDCGSTCGTFVNGKRIANGNQESRSPGEPTPLKDGDIISLGSSGASMFIFGLLED